MVKPFFAGRDVPAVHDREGFRGKRCARGRRALPACRGEGEALPSPLPEKNFFTILSAAPLPDGLALGLLDLDRSESDKKWQGQLNTAVRTVLVM